MGTEDIKICDYCKYYITEPPKFTCDRVLHWKIYSLDLAEENYELNHKLSLKDEDRDKIDVAECIMRIERTIDYKCRGCGRNFVLPIHLDHYMCSCGLECRLRHIGGINPIEDVIDAAIQVLGVERMAQLAYSVELFVDDSNHETKEDFKKYIEMIMDQWIFGENGWVKKK